jgi:hypothetical protein
MSDVVKAEWVPGHVEYEGPAKVSEYFDSRIQTGKNGQIIGFFRGHELVGRQLPIPENYCMSLVTVKDRKLEQVEALDPVRVWDVDGPSLDVTLQFADIIEVGRILAED